MRIFQVNPVTEKFLLTSERLKACSPNANSEQPKIKGRKKYFARYNKIRKQVKISQLVVALVYIS